MYYYSKKSRRKVVHDGDCFYIQNVDGDSIGIFESLDEAYAHGYRLCRHCSPLAVQYRKEVRQLSEYCRKQAASFFFNDRFIGVYTPNSKWRIVPATTHDGFDLYHKNTIEKNKDNDSPVPGYHLQRVYRKTLMEYFECVVDHEYYRMTHPLYIRPDKKEKAPPRKGTKRYRKQQAKAEKRARKQSIINVLNLIDGLSEPAIPSYRAIYA